jgi:chromosome partitioning protein
MKTIAIANQKGGTAKTTTAAALGVLLSRAGIHVHMVDMDPQSSLTQAFGCRDAEDRLYNALTSRAGLPIDELSPTLTLSPSSVELGRAETELMTEPGREYYLRTCLQNTDLPDDAVVLFDCPPSLGLLAVNCMAAAGGMIAPVQPGGFELHALAHLHMTVETIRERLQPDLCILGAVVANAHLRRAITDQVRDEVDRLHPVLGVVRTDARMLYATSSGAMLRLNRSRALEDYAAVAEQLECMIQ